MVLVEPQTQPDVPVLVVAGKYMAAAVVADFPPAPALLFAELPVHKALCELSGPVAHVHSHQPIQETCKWNYLFVLQTV
jgi:hypothetical protein